MKTKAVVLKIEGSKVWLAVEPESCSICPAASAKRDACAGCDSRALSPFTAKNSLRLPLKPGMKVSASFTTGRTLIQAAASFGFPLALALVAYLAAPALPLPAKPVSALAALVAAALLVCAASAFVKQKFPRAYGEMEIMEILEDSKAFCFPEMPEKQNG